MKNKNNIDYGSFNVTASCDHCKRAALMNHSPTCFLVRVAHVVEAGAELAACRSELDRDLDAAHGHAYNAFCALWRAGLTSLFGQLLALGELIRDDLASLAENQLDDIAAAICAGTVAA